MASALDELVAPSPCEQCGNATEGTMRCSVRDSKNLCQGCFQNLPQARREDIGDPEWVCDIHLNHKVDIFCETCRLGCCKECAVDVHKGHKVVNVLKHVGEIRCDLTELLQEVDVRADGLSELQREIEGSRGKMEETPTFLNNFFDEIKEEIAQNLEKEIHIIQRETQLNIIHEKRKGDNLVELEREKAHLKIQKIQEIQHCISTGLREDAEKRRCKIQKAESELLVGQQACESAKLEIKSLLESTPEKLACRGRPLCSLVKASSAFHCQNDVRDCCREVEADLPKLRVKRGNFFNEARPFSPLLEFVLCTFVVFFIAYDERVNSRYEYNRFLSSKSVTSLIMPCLYFPTYHALKCCIFTLLLPYSVYGYPIKRKALSMKKLKYCIKMVPSALGLWLLAVLFLILVSSPLYLSQVKSVSANIVSIMSLLQSCFYMYGMRNSKSVKDYCDYLKLYKY